jgi:hypothetical protein
MSEKDHAHAAKIAKTHTIYKLRDGTRVPGTTTITGVMDKPALVKWANGLGLQGLEVGKYVDELALIGTLAHYMIECHCTGEKPNLDDYSKNQIALAENSYLKWMMWQDQVGFVPEHNELILVSEVWRFGGTIDIIGRLTKRGNKRVLVDIKTCKGIYGEHKTQVAGGYKILADEHVDSIGLIDEVLITRVGRNGEEGFEEITVSSEESAVHQERFKICRKLYDINAVINKTETAIWKSIKK